METEIQILFQNNFLSKKQYRTLLGSLPADITELKNRLLEAGWLDLPDWDEAELVLKPDSNTQYNQDKAPDTNNEIMSALHTTALQIANSETTVLLLGESGVGKSRLASLIHENSPRRNGPFVTVSCGSIPDSLLESELFGVIKGAYTGANKSRDGRFKRAEGGTIFLDEIGELGPGLQVKLLRVIQEKLVEPLGASGEIRVDVRLITATNRNLEDDIKSGRFRKDLYFRLNVIPLTLPSLSARTEDIIPLAEYFIKQFENKTNRHYHILNDGLKETLLNYNWPGNIRELENCIERLIVLADHDGNLHCEDLPPRMIPELNQKTNSAPLFNKRYTEKTIQGSLLDSQKALIRTAMENTSGSISKSAKILGVHRNTLRNKLKAFNLNPALFKKK